MQLLYDVQKDSPISLQKMASVLVDHLVNLGLISPRPPIVVGFNGPHRTRLHTRGKGGATGHPRKSSLYKPGWDCLAGKST